MKLICIATPNRPCPIGIEDWWIYIGQEYESIGSEINSEGFYYYLEGKPSFCIYAAEFFAIVPDQSAEEMSEENRESIANLEHV